MPARHPLSRRTALGLVAGGALGLASTACDVDDLRPPDDDGAAPSPTPTAPDEPTADEALVEQVVTALRDAVVTLGAASTVAAVRPSVRPLLRAHRAHLAALDSEPPETGVVSLPTDAPTALRMVRDSERELSTLLVDTATEAESGALARLLASAAASVSQHLAVLA